MADILAAAGKLDRRRIAQIENQKQSINRLLEAMPHSKGSMATYTQEMEVLHGAAAAISVELEDTEKALRQLVDVVVRITPTGELPDDLDEALAEATRLIGPKHDAPPIRGELIPGTPYYGPPLSAPVSESGASAG